MTATPSNGTQPAVELPLIGLSEMCDLLPVAKQTVYRWRISRNGSPPALPHPRLEVSTTPLWTLSQVQEFAKERGLKLDAPALRRIRRGQGVGKSS